MKKLLIPAMISVLSSSSIQANDYIKYSDKAFEESKANHQVTILDFSADWNPDSIAQRIALKEIFKDPEIKRNVAVIRIDYDRAKKLLKRHGVEIESTMIFYKQGFEYTRIVGERDRNVIKQLIMKGI